MKKWRLFSIEQIEIQEIIYEKKDNVAHIAVLISAIFFSLITIALCAPENNGTDRWKGQEADLLLLNGSIYTVNEKVDWDKHPEQVLAISGKRIAYVGNDSSALGLIGPETRIVDLAGKMVLPGFIESQCE